MRNKKLKSLKMSLKGINPRSTSMLRKGRLRDDKETGENISLVYPKKTILKNNLLRKGESGYIAVNYSESAKNSNKFDREREKW